MFLFLSFSFLSWYYSLLTVSLITQTIPPLITQTFSLDYSDHCNLTQHPLYYAWTLCIIVSSYPLSTVCYSQIELLKSLL
jgi:hypothetical protein